MDRHEAIQPVKQRPRVEAESAPDLDEVVGRFVVEIGEARAGAGGRRDRPKALNDQPYFDGNPPGRQQQTPLFSASPRAADDLDHDHGNDTVDGELALKKTDAEDESEPHRPAASHPEQQRIQKRLDVSPRRLQKQRCCAGRRQQEEQARDERHERAQSQLALEQRHEQQPHRKVDREERQLERRH
jgi:hypothetical protein